MSKGHRERKPKTGRGGSSAPNNSSVQNHTKQPTGPAAPNNATMSENIAAISPEIGPTNAGPITNANLQSRAKNPGSKFDWMTFFTGCLVVVGFLTILIMGWQNFLIAASIDTANEANKISREAFESTQRAWVAPDRVIASGDFKEGGEARAVVEFRNVGREPANGVKFQTGIAWPKPGQSVEWKDYCALARAKSDAGFTAYPSENITYNANTNLFPGTIAESIVNGETVLHLNGCIVYSTLNQEHFSRFCFYWISKANAPMSEWNWRYCQNGNESN